MVTTINYYPISMTFCTVVDVYMISKISKYVLSRSSVFFYSKINFLKNLIFFKMFILLEMDSA